MSIKSGRLICKFIGSDSMELLLFYLFLLGFLSVPTTIAGMAAIFHHDTPTKFPPSHPHVGFVPGPDRRGTMNVVWVCMSTIFTCVYVSVHVDVPDITKARELSERVLDGSSGIRRVFLRAFGAICRFTAKPTCKRIVWMLFNVFAPELVVLVAALELFSARDGMRYMRLRGQHNWTMKLAFFADMGGFEWRDGSGASSHLRSGLEFLEWFDDTRRNPQLSARVLDVQSLKLEIDDRCKANMVLKVFTLLQASWLLVETIVRLAENKAVSELEVTTCAYIFCTVVAYGCWLRKPYDVSGRIVIREETFIIPDTTLPSLTSPKAPHSTSLSYVSTAYTFVSLHEPGSDAASEVTAIQKPSTFKNEEGTQDTEQTSNFIPLPTMIYDGARSSPFNRSYFKPDSSWPFACNVAGVMGTIVGFIHAAPLWNALFYYEAGQWLWRFCCIVQVATPVSIAMITLIERVYIGKPLFLAMLIGAFFYCVSRMVLFSLIWISFLSLPASVYTDIDWSWAYFPHWH